MIRLLLNRPVHVSWLVALASVGIVLGVIWAGNGPQMGSIAWLLTGVGLLLTALMGGRAWLILFAVAGGLILGLWRGSGVQQSVAQFQEYRGRTVAISGTVSEDIDKNKQGKFIIRLRNITVNNTSFEGTIWVTVRDAHTIRRSDRVDITGKVSDGFGSFAASVYHADVRSVQRPVPGDIALGFRDYFAAGVRSALTETEASLGLGYLVGQRRGLPAELDQALQAAGLTHIVVASGYNLTILVRLARRLLEKISKYLSFVASIGMIGSFIAITGISPSMSRAGLIAGLSLLAWYYGRRFHPLVLLLLAMAITLLFQPSYAWGDLGWQLSFAAFGGVMILAPLIQVYFFGDKKEQPVRRIFIETIAATIATLPILLGAFGQFSVVAPLANMLILPFIPLAMLLTFAAGLGALVVPVLAGVIGFPAQVVLSYMAQAAYLMGELPWAVQEMKMNTFGISVAYIGIVCACIYMTWATRYDLRRSSLIE